MDSATPPPYAPGQSAWQRFSVTAVRAFHRYAAWLVSLSWKRFIGYSLVLMILTGIVSNMPPFSWTYTETTSASTHHHKSRPAPAPPAMSAMPATPAVPAMPAGSMPAMPGTPGTPGTPALPAVPPKAASGADTSPTIHITKLPDTGTDSPSKTVNIRLPGIVIEKRGPGGKARPGEVNISIGPNGIRIEGADKGEAESAAAAASAAQEAAASAVAAAQTAASQALGHAKAAASTAQSHAAQLKADADKLHHDALKAAAESLAPASLPRPTSNAASASTNADGERVVEMDAGDRHIRIVVPAGTDTEAIRDAIDSAKQQLADELEQARDQAKEEAEQARQAIEDAQQAERDRMDGDSGNEDDGPTTRVHTVRYGESLPLLSFWWIVFSLITKLAYKGRLQAETKAAVLAETAEAESLRRQVIEARMAMMQAQVEPHFLFNTLASIDHLIEVDPKRASRMQRNLIALLRASMPTMREANDGGLRPLEREMAVIRPYLEILQVRMEERLATSVDVPDGLHSAEFPPMMIQTLVENAIKHGLEPKPEGGSLAVKAEIRHGKLVVTVSDTGLGFTQASGDGLTSGTGVGLANIRERLAMLYGNKASLTITDNPGGGTIATITVPYTTRTSEEGASA
jgi:signal transduction histidine kinase